jgi:hypothetical protein
MVPSGVMLAPPVPELGAADFSILLQLARQAVEAAVAGRGPSPGACRLPSSRPPRRS